MKKRTILWIMVTGTLIHPVALKSWIKQPIPVNQAAPLTGDPIKVQCEVGCVPTLPYRVLVTNSNGEKVYRQVKWLCATPEKEAEMADATLHPVGSSYQVEGVILGDKSATLQALVTVVKASEAQARIQANPLPLNDVKLTGKNRLTHNRDLALKEICSWDVTQQLYNYRDTYNMSTTGYTRADGWDAPDIKLKGHGAGHYMSALALAYAVAEEPEQKEILRKNITRMVNELRACQEKTFVWSDSLGRYFEARDYAPEAELREMKGTWAAFDEYKKHPEKYGYGYLNAIPAAHPALIEMYRAYNNADWVWAPYYTIHKQLAGLIDIATYFDDEAIKQKALLIAKDMGLWVWNRMHYRTFVSADGDEAKRRARPGNRYEMWNMYIAGEVGGIGESLARLSEMVSDPIEKAHLLEASNCFDGDAFFNPLKRNIDEIRTRHANQHIPMIIAALRSYQSNHDMNYYKLSENFWTLIQGRYRYATGGVGNGEMFRQPYSQMMSMVTNGVSAAHSHANPDLNETCCAYNLLKLTRDLNAYNPDDARYMDYYERTLYNQIVGSLNPERYQTTYQYAVGLDATKPFGNETPQSTCCGGTGSENHVKYQEAAYFASSDALWVALYLPTQATWKEKGVVLKQDCEWPAPQSSIKIEQGEATFALHLRVPYWATQGFEVRLNGKKIAKHYTPSSYVTIPARQWKVGDEVSITMPFSKHLDYGADPISNRQLGIKDLDIINDESWLGAVMYGPLVMTGTGVSTWDEAVLHTDARLSAFNKIESDDAQSTPALACGHDRFLPDYYRHSHTTHYYRILPQQDSLLHERTQLSDALLMAGAYPKAHYTRSSHKALTQAVKKAHRVESGKKSCKQDFIEAQKNISSAIANLQGASGVINTQLARQTLNGFKQLDKQLYTTASYELAHAAASQLEHSFSTTQSKVDGLTFSLNQAVKAMVKASEVDKSELQELLAMATRRMQDNQAWQVSASASKGRAPWAPHGLERMKKVAAQSQDVLDNKHRIYSQREVAEQVENLNASLVAMRPGNLAEVEDLEALNALIHKVEGQGAPSDAKRKALGYAHMVVRYVSDGSGTHDMIQTAMQRLSAAQ